MKQKPQGRLEGTLIGALAKSRPGVIMSNWVFQGMRYMNGYELGLKLLVDLFLIVLVLALFSWWFNPALILMAFIFSHTVNWILNGHIFVLLRYVWPVPTSKEEFERYINELKVSAHKAKNIDGLAVFGSYCRGQLHEHSDLDVRVTIAPGFTSGMSGALYCALERAKAFFRAFPLDIYCSSDPRSLDRLRDDEHPVILVDKSGALAERYDKSETRE